MTDAKAHTISRSVRSLALVAGAAAIACGIMHSNDWQHFFIALCVAPVFLLGGWSGMAHALRALRLWLAGHVATATVVAHRPCGRWGERSYLAIVNFDTRNGECRTHIPLRAGREAPRPAVGQVMPIVYDPRNPAWAEEWLGLSWTTFAAMATSIMFGLGLLFGWAGVWFACNRILPCALGN
jgi:hypothetical protein